MSALKRLLNDDDQADDDLRYGSVPSQSLSLTSFSSQDEDTPPVLPEGTWNSLFTDLHGTVVDNGEAFDFPDFGAFDVPDPGFLQLQHDVEQWGSESFPLNDVTHSKGKGSPTVFFPAGADEHLEFGDEAPQLLCYGLIYRAAAKLMGDMSDVRRRLTSSEVPKIAGNAIFRIEHFAGGLWLTFADGTKFAQLNAHISKTLPTILKIQYVELEGLVDIIAFRQTIERATKPEEASTRVNINVYGTPDAKAVVGLELSRAKIFLQQPDHPREGTTYDNPHFLQLENFFSEQVAIDARNEDEPMAEGPPETDFRTTVQNIYRSLKRGAHLQKLEGDASLQTALLPHQQEALDFMTQRETGPIPEQFCLWQREDGEQEGEACYRHVITKALSHEHPSEIGGGVLADAMGLGKTLSVLSLVAKTRDEAREWSGAHLISDPLDAEISRKPSRATLVLVSSYLLLNHWMSEVKRHLNGSFGVIKYHGQRRERKVAVISDSDIVLTTYHTLAAEMADNASPLHEIVWYRIVLDEAHIIRHRNTTFYQTCLQLEAANRWCLTGTPIQNTLDDIGALFSFIRVRPFESIGTFRSNITVPFDEGLERRALAAERLTMLLDALCLRRTRDVVELPEQREMLRELNLSPGERDQYQQTKEMMNRAIRQRFGELDRKNVFGLFQAQLQLRLFCNHGTFQNPFSWTNHRNMITERESALDLFGQSGEVTCACCHQPLPITSTNSTYSRYYSCRHVCCLECLEQTADGDELDPELRASRCPVCETSNMGDRKKKQRAHRGVGLEASSGYFRETGFSTKMEALTADVLTDLMNNKSVIFSCWTRTLDLVEKHFERAGLPFNRIDGTSALHARQATLDDFSSNPRSPILLMTTGTGAFGLNIPVATRVFIVESQWNPHTERQAIARAMRLGQDHPIIVYRYVINQSVEQEMRSQQERKLHIAEVGW